MTDFQFHWCEQYIPWKPSIIFDIGSYDGNAALQFKQRYPEAQVYAFEASPTVYSGFRQKEELRTQIVYTHLALSDSEGQTIFYESSGVNDCSGSILKSTHKRDDMKFSAGVPVPMTTLENFCRNNGVNFIDVIHMDVQGAEYKVMKGLGNLRPKMVFAETAEYENYDGSLTRDDLDNLMASLGYRVELRLQYDTLYILNK